MSEEKEFQQRLRRIGALIDEIESIADPVARASTRQLVQLVMEFHGLALNRTLEILADSGEPGMKLMDQLGRDPMVSGLLVLYGLHPDPWEKRVQKAVEQLEAKLRRDGASIELLGMQDGAVHIRITPGAHACGSTSKALKTTVEDAIYEAAPDITALTLEGLDGQPANGFVALEKLTESTPIASKIASPAVANYGD